MPTSVTNTLAIRVLDTTLACHAIGWSTVNTAKQQDPLDATAHVSSAHHSSFGKWAVATPCT
jgi:hypothetical protein